MSVPVARFEHLADELRQRALAEAEVELARIGLGIGDELGERLGRHVGRDHQHQAAARDRRDRHEVLQRIVGQRLVDQRRDEMRRAVGDEQSIAIRLGAHHGFHADGGAAAGRLSTTTDWPSCAAMGVAISRATTSLGEPGVNGAMILIGRSGKVCADAGAASTPANTSAATSIRTAVISIARPPAWQRALPPAARCAAVLPRRL